MLPSSELVGSIETESNEIICYRQHLCSQSRVIHSVSNFWINSYIDQLAMCLTSCSICTEWLKKNCVICWADMAKKDDIILSKYPAKITLMSDYARILHKWNKLSSVFRDALWLSTNELAILVQDDFCWIMSLHSADCTIFPIVSWSPMKYRVMKYCPQDNISEQIYGYSQLL